MKSSLKRFGIILLLVAAGGVIVASNAIQNGAGVRIFKTAAAGGPPAKANVTVSDAPVAREGKAITSFAPVVKKVAPAVVYIYTTKTVKHPQIEGMNPFGDEFLRRFFGNPRTPRPFKERGLGSGVIVTKDGYILTNNHVVEGADEVKVTLATDKRQYDAKLVGRDSKTDIAVLKIEGTNYPSVTLGDSDKIEVGDIVLAVGNPFGIGQTVTMGIISGVSRNNVGIEEYEDFIQTDAAINPGNSGGALVDAEGRLIGINTAILSRSGGNMGVGFAVPMNLARNIMDRLISHGKVVRGFMGVSIQDVTPDLAKEFGVPETGGALIGGVQEKGAAEAAGIKSGDVIIEIDGKPVRDSRTLRLLVGSMSPGTKINVKYLRDGKERTVQMNLKEMPAELAGNSGEGSSTADDGDALDGVVVADLDAKTRAQFKVPADIKGAIITSVEQGSASAEAGLREGDVIVEINRKPVANADDAVEASKNVKSKRVLVRVWSNGGTRYVVVDETKKDSK